MLAVFLKLIVMQPQLLLTHVKNYADLMMEGLQHNVNQWKLRVFLYAMSFALFVLGAMAGVMALLLWAALPVLHPQNAWVLVVLPSVLLMMSASIYGFAQRYKIESMFEDIQEQLDLDLLAIGSARLK